VVASKVEVISEVIEHNIDGMCFSPTTLEIERSLWKKTEEGWLKVTTLGIVLGKD
jgi:tRNA A58 N-methylase Trm61